MNNYFKNILYVHDGPVRFYTNGDMIITDNIMNLEKRYNFFSNHVTFMYRGRNSDIIKSKDVIDKNVNIIIIPTFNNIKKLHNYFKAKNLIKKYVREFDCLIIRLPSSLGSVALRYAKKFKIPYIVEVVACPWDVLWNFSIIGKLYAPFAYLKMKRNVYKSEYVIYVSEKFLQNRYPTIGNNTNISNVYLPFDEEFIISKKIDRYKSINKNNKIIFCTLAALDVPYKGQSYVLKAIAKLKSMGYNIEYQLAGSGDKSIINEQIKELDLEANVIVEGFINSNKVNQLLEKVDIYIQPSKTEGLPRAIIEAMHRGCVCLGSNVGGIPELLEERFLFDAGNVNQLVKLLQNTIDRQDLSQIAFDNYLKSKNFEIEVLSTKRIEFYTKFVDNVKHTKK